jgi:ribosomal protein L7Ae-like RNA K-turn-binding protein
MRSGELKAGGNLVDRLVKRDWPAALVISTDVGKTVADDLGRKAWGKEIPLLTSILTSDELGVALGKPGPRSVLAVGYGPLAEALTLELKRGLALS